MTENILERHFDDFQIGWCKYVTIVVNNNGDTFGAFISNVWLKTCQNVNQICHIFILLLPISTGS